jgi:hypothetical protein
MTQNVDATWYVKIGGLGTTSGLYRFTTREAAAGDAPILLDVPDTLSSRIDPLQPMGSDESIAFSLAYEDATHGGKVRPLLADPSDPRVVVTGSPRQVIQLTESISPTTTTLKLTSTAGLSTGALYYLGGEAITFSAFPSSTTATTARGVLSPEGEGRYHSAQDELGPVLTSTLATGAGQPVEFGQIVGGSETVLFRGRIRDDGIRLRDGVAIEVEAVSYSSILRHAAYRPPAGVVLARVGTMYIPPGATEVERYDGGVMIYTDDHGPSAGFTGAGYVHITDTKTGQFCTFSFSGFGSETTLLDRPVRQVEINTGDSLVMIGNTDGAQGIAMQVVRRDGEDREEGGTVGAYAYAADIIYRDQSHLRAEIATWGTNLRDCIEAALSNPPHDVDGMSAQIPASAVDTALGADVFGIRNVRAGSSAEAFILPPTEAERVSSYRVNGQGRIGSFRQRGRTLKKTLEDTCLRPFGLSLATTTTGTVRLVDWLTQARRYDLFALAEADLADTQSEQEIKAGPAPSIVAVTPPKQGPLRDPRSDQAVETEAAIVIVTTPQPVTSGQIQSMEQIPTGHAAGSLDQVREIVARMESACDMYGLPRPELTISYLGGPPVAGGNGASTMQPGDYCTITHPDVAAKGGSRGLTDARAICVERRAETRDGTITLRLRVLGHADQDLATWAPCGRIVSWLAPNLTIEANAFTDADAYEGPTTDAEAFDLDLPSTAMVLDSTGAVRGGGTINSRSGNVLNFTPAKGLVPAAGDLITFTVWSGTAGEWLGFTPVDNGGPPVYGAGIDDALGGVPGDPAQRYR